MTPRRTDTGRVLEDMLLPAFKRNGYEVEERKAIGDRLGGGRHFVDALAHKGDRHIIVSSKWQESSGTAEQKVPFEVICLLAALDDGNYTDAFLILGGTDVATSADKKGWKLREFYLRGGLKKYIVGAEKVTILKPEEFISRLNKGKI